MQLRRCYCVFRQEKVLRSRQNLLYRLYEK